MLSLKKFLFEYQNSSFPTRILASNNREYILKMKNTGNDTKNLIREFIVNRSFHRLGFPIPDVELVRIDHGFPWTFGTDEFDDILQKSYGINLGIHSIPHAHPFLDCDELKKKIDFVNEMLALDIFFRNFDRTRESNNVLIDENSKLWMIDHGSCIFFDTMKSDTNFLPGNHFLMESDFSDGARVFLDRFIVYNFEKIVSEIPDEWLDESGIDQSNILQSLERRKEILMVAR